MGCPAGLNADLDYITEVEEAHLLAFLALQKWTRVGHREECQFGYGYFHDERRVIKIDAIPKELWTIVESLSSAKSPPKVPDQGNAVPYTRPIPTPPPPTHP